MSTDPTREKWERRRAARRARPAPVEPPAALVERPWCVDRAFVFWMLIGVPTAIALVGIVVIAAAFNMRAGYRGGRVLLTVMAAPSFLMPIGLLTADGASGWALLLLLPCVVPIIATVLMWHPDASAYFRAGQPR